jgi:DDE domain
VDETSIKIKTQWHYLYRTVDSMGATLDFMVSATRDADAAERFFRQVLQASHTCTPRVITVDKNAAYPPAFESLQQEKTLPESCQLRQCKYLNNIVEQDHRFVKHRVNPGLGFGAFATAQRTIQGYETMHMLYKGQIEGMIKGDVLTQNRIINQLCGLAASRALASLSSPCNLFLQHNPFPRSADEGDTPCLDPTSPLSLLAQEVLDLLDQLRRVGSVHLGRVLRLAPRCVIVLL